MKQAFEQLDEDSDNYLTVDEFSLYFHEKRDEL